MTEIQSGTLLACALSKAAGRRRASSDTIGDIQRAARQEFASRGFDDTTVDGIARRANVSKQLLYYYFGSKADLYSMILDEAAVETDAFKHKADYDGLAPDLAMRAFIDDTFADFVNRPQIIRMTVDEAKHAFAHVSKKSAVASLLRDAIRVVGRILQRGKDAGIFARDADADAVFWAIHALATAWFAHHPMIALISGDKLTGSAGLESWQRFSHEFIAKFIARNEP